VITAAPGSVGGVPSLTGAGAAIKRRRSPDYAFQQGIEAVEAITTGSREDVYWHPGRF
jgi:hypothetical protein